MPQRHHQPQGYLFSDQLTSMDTLKAALTRYQQVWQPVITEKQRIARRGAKWFLPSSSLRHSSPAQRR